MASRMDLNGWYKLRWEVLERDGFTCQYCGQAAPDVKLEVDHKLSLADGGTNDLNNLVATCWACNRGKSGLRQAIILKRERSNTRIKDLPNRQLKILDLLSDNPGLTAKQIADIQSVSLPAVWMACRRLLASGKIKRDGKRYFIT